MRVSLLGLLGAAALGFSAMSALPAQAQGLSITIGEPHGHRLPPPVHRDHRRYVPIHRHHHVPPVHATGSFRQAILGLIVFFVVGSVILLFTDTTRAIHEAGNLTPEEALKET